MRSGRAAHASSPSRGASAPLCAASSWKTGLPAAAAAIGAGEWTDNRRIGSDPFSSRVSTTAR